MIQWLKRKIEAYEAKDADWINPAREWMGVDKGIPSQGVRYGGGDTIHNTGTIDVQIRDGKVDMVWFRCRNLAFEVVDYDQGIRYSGEGAPLVAIETV